MACYYSSRKLPFTSFRYWPNAARHEGQLSGDVIIMLSGCIGTKEPDTNPRPMCSLCNHKVPLTFGILKPWMSLCSISGDGFASIIGGGFHQNSQWGLSGVTV